MRLRAIIFCVLLFSLNSFARNWQEIKIPGAVCGDGNPYSIFVDYKSSKNVVIEFMGGGACWDAETCYGYNLRAWIHMTPMPIPSVLASENASGNYLHDHSYIYFPYCTGDVHAGASIAYYEPGKPVFHYGRLNFVKTLKYLSQNKLVNFAKIENLLVWGSSAGGIGAMTHLRAIDKYLSKTNINKVVIADSPGLHFGENFFAKFSLSYFNDLKRTFQQVSFAISPDTGLLTGSLPKFFTANSDWQIGIMQSTKDIIMSSVFGNISPQDHRELVLGRRGFLAVSQPYPNAHVWSTDSYMHTFLLTTQSMNMSSLDGSETALEFARQVYLKNFFISSGL